MPGSRGPNQKLITFHVEDLLFDATEKSRGRTNRSQWIRDAIIEKLKREGVALPEGIELPPDRSGVGGRPKKETAMLNGEEPESGSEKALPARKKVSYKTARKKAKE